MKFRTRRQRKMDERLKRQLDFALEIDKEKNILRPWQTGKRCRTCMAYGDYGISFQRAFKRIGGYCKGNADVSDP